MKKQVLNPFLPSWEYIPDGEPRLFGDRLYLYGSHDAFNGADFCVNDYVLWSAPLSDLSDWRCEGVIYRAAQDPRNKNGRMHMNAPDCVRGADGRYYLYYQLHMLTCTSVAVADRPEGPFEHYGYVQHPDGIPWGEKKGDTFAFDPGVRVDDDGRIYLYVGFSPIGWLRTVFKLRGNHIEEAVCLELEADMKTVKGNEQPIVPGPAKATGTEFEGHGFFEASSIRKMNGKYYFVYSSILSHELCYAVSDFPNKDFRYGGTLVSIADIGYKGNTEPLNYTGNTHGGMCEIDGQWHIFYHRQTNKIKCSRQACAENLTLLPDGSIPQVEVTSCGLNGAPLSGRGKYEARIACNLSGKDGMLDSSIARKKDKKSLLPYFTQSGEDRESDGDQYIANLRNGAWCGYKYFELDQLESIAVTVRGTGKGWLRVSTEPKGMDIGMIPVCESADWTEAQATLWSPVSGCKALYFTFYGTGSMDFAAFELQ